eukprot:3270911-Rhodomonas_salina.1
MRAPTVGGERREGRGRRCVCCGRPGFNKALFRINKALLISARPGFAKPHAYRHECARSNAGALVCGTKCTGTEVEMCLIWASGAGLREDVVRGSRGEGARVEDDRGR